MKTIFIFGLLISATHAFAREAVCFDSSNSDYQITLNLDTQGLLTTIAYSNIDWGSAGMGEPQTVKNVGPNIYQVVTPPQSRLGLQRDAKVELRLDRSSILQEVLISKSGSEATFRCN